MDIGPISRCGGSHIKVAVFSKRTRASPSPSPLRLFLHPRKKPSDLHSKLISIHLLRGTIDHPRAFIQSQNTAKMNGFRLYGLVVISLLSTILIAPTITAAIPVVERRLEEQQVKSRSGTGLSAVQNSNLISDNWSGRLTYI